ncbi:MAG: zinc metallopeptidase [Anaerolineaceae bacterium]|nr:zinc metallopeptidase [Anaerolineaceae bacterium]
MYFEYFLYMIPGLLLSLFAQSKVKSAYNKWSQVRNYHNLTGLETAEQLKPRVGLENVKITRTKGTLTDHYDPRDDTLALSPEVADQPSVAAMAITAHELGHAMQDKTSYGPMRLRTTIVPLVSFGSNIGIILVMIGVLLSLSNLATIGVVLFSSTAVFSLVTLPVELDASKRARAMLDQTGLVANEEERVGVKQMLDAAAWTYVAGLATSLMQLLYYISVAGRASGRRR